MKWRWFTCLIFLSGCISTAPTANFLDFVKPGKMYKDRLTPYGGVCIPGQGTIPIAPGLANLPTTPPVAVPVIPGPAPLPGPGGSAGSITIPPPPPPPTLR